MPDSQTKRSQAIAVLGMHRSGTSAVMRVLNLLGVAVGSNMMIPTADNERGYWEQQEINNIHIVLMKALGRNWSDISDLPVNWLQNADLAEPIRRLREVIQREFNNVPLWGIKDPRMCLLVPLWLDLIQSINVDPSFVFVVRNPLEVAQSISRRDGISISRGLMIWLHYSLTAERDTRTQKRIFIGYRQLLDNWQSVTDRISRHLNIAWPISNDIAKPQIESFLEPSLRKQQVDDKTFLANPSIPELIRRAYAVFLEAANGKTESLAATLDAISSDLVPKVPLVSEAMEGIERDNTRLREMLEQDRLTNDAQKAQLRFDLNQSHQRINALEQQGGTLQQQLAALIQQSSDSQMAIGRLQTENQSLQQDSATQKHLLHDQLQSLQSQSKQLATELRQTQLSLQQARDRADHTERQLQLLNSVHDSTLFPPRRASIRVGEAKKRRVLFVSHGHPDVKPGGAEIYAWEVYQGFQSSDSYEPLFLAKGGESYAEGRVPHPGTHITADPRDPHVYFLHPGNGNYDFFLGTIRARASIIEDYPAFLRTHRPDVVHFQHTVFLGYDIIRQTRNILGDVPIVYTLHEYMPICNADGQMIRRHNKELCTHASTRRCHECFPKNAPQEFFLREQFVKSHFALVDMFVAPSRFLMERYIQWGIPRQKICYEENGRNLPSALPDSESQERPHNRLAFFGQINPYKGIDLLLAAMSKLEKQPFDESIRPVLNVYGANLEIQMPDFVERVRQLLRDTEKHVTFCGPYKTHHLPQIMANVDWVVIPSIWWENAPLVIQEAFHFGKPVICSNIGGMAEKVRNGVDGMHFEVSNADSLAHAITKAVSTPGLWEQMRANIRPVHSMPKHLENLSIIYDALLDNAAHAEVTLPKTEPLTLLAKVNN